MAILIAEVLFQQFLIHTADITGAHGTISFFQYAWIAEVLFKQFLIRNAVLNIADNDALWILHFSDDNWGVRCHFRCDMRRFTSHNN